MNIESELRLAMMLGDDLESKVGEYKEYKLQEFESKEDVIKVSLVMAYLELRGKLEGFEDDTNYKNKMFIELMEGKSKDDLIFMVDDCVYLLGK